MLSGRKRRNPPLRVGGGIIKYRVLYTYRMSEGRIKRFKNVYAESEKEAIKSVENDYIKVLKVEVV